MEHNKLSLDMLDQISKVLEVEPLDILQFDEQYVFNSISHNQTGGETKSGIFHDSPLIAELRGEIATLRLENERLNSLVKK